MTAADLVVRNLQTVDRGAPRCETATGLRSGTGFAAARDGERPERLVAPKRFEPALARGGREAGRRARPNDERRGVERPWHGWGDGSPRKRGARDGPREERSWL